MKGCLANKELSEVIEYAEKNKNNILSIDERLKFYLKAIEIGTKINLLGIYQISTGYPSESNNLIHRAAQVETSIFSSFIISTYTFTYSEPLSTKFNEARLFIARCFIENYTKMDRFELSDHLHQANKDKDFLEVLAENENVFIHPVIVFKALYNSILAQLYILADRENDALSSLMNASYFFGASIQFSAPLTEHQAQNIIDIDISKRTQKASDARWQGHVESIRQKYLELDTQRQKELDKQLKIKESAMWIYNNHNHEDLEYETIRDHLSKARKGIFTND